MKIVQTLTRERGTILSKFVLQLLFMMFMVEFVKGALLITFLPFYMKNVLGASAYVIGWTLAVQYTADNLLRTPIGWVIDKLGYRISMLSGVTATLISVVIIATTNSFYWMIVGCALLGIGTAPLWPCVITGATEITGHEKSGTVMSIVYLAWLCGVGLGPLVITFFLEGHFSAAFRMMIAAMAAVFIVALFLPGKQNPQVSRTDGENETRHTRKKGKAALPQRIKTYLKEVSASLTVSPLLFPAMFAQTFALGLLTPVLVIFATNVLGLSQGQFRWLLITGGAVTVGFLIPVGKMVDRWGKRWFLIVGFFLGSISLLLFPFARTFPLLLVVVLMLGTAYALIIPAWNALIAAAIPPEKRGAVWGFFLTIEGLGTTVGPIISGKLWDKVGPQAPFLTAGVVLFLLLLLQFAISARKKNMVR